MNSVIDQLAWYLLWRRQQHNLVPDDGSPSKIYLWMVDFAYRVCKWFVELTSYQRHGYTTGLAQIATAVPSTDIISALEAQLELELEAGVRKHRFAVQYDSSESSSALSLNLKCALALKQATDDVCLDISEKCRIEANWDVHHQKYLDMFNNVFAVNRQEGLAHDLNSSNSDQNDEDLGEADEDAPLLSKQKTRTTSSNEGGPYQFDSAKILAVPEPSDKGKSKLNWVALGFQGSDPSRDFRSSGEFGIMCFDKLCSDDPELTKQMLVESGSFLGDVMLPWYSFALASIHLSTFVARLSENNISLIRGINRTINWDDIVKSSESQIDQTKLRQSVLDAVIGLHNRLVKRFHNEWLFAVGTGSVKSVMDTDAFIKRYERQTVKLIWDGDWTSIWDFRT